MTRILLTGGSGFIATHILDILLERGHSVVTTVRTEGKVKNIKDAHPNISKEQLDFFLVEDVAKPGAFDDAVKSGPPFDAVIHTASPFHFNVTDVKKDLLDPAIMGTTGILKAIKKSAPTVKRVVITSSFAAIVNSTKGNRPGHVYSEADWNPVTEEQAVENPQTGYRASKTFAEKAAWDFVETEKPDFTLSTVNPPMVFGPVSHFLHSLDALNTSNQRIRDIMAGQTKEGLPATGVFFWVDVRDVALAHVKAVEVPAAAGKRFFVTAGYFSNKEIAEILREAFPDLAVKIPVGEALKPGDFPEGGLYKYDNSKAKDLLGIEFRTLKDCIVETAKSLQAVEK